MAFRPRKRAASQVPRVKWLDVSEKGILGFVGYKSGMTHIAYIDESDSATKGQEIVTAVTVVETPPLVVYGVRCYDDEKSICDILTEDEKILKKLGIKKLKKKQINEDDVKDVRLLVFSQPAKTGIGKKHIERMEIGVGGPTPKEKLEYAKSFIGKELRISDVFKAGEYVDVIAVTKGKGWQGVVKRFGVSLQRPKATGRRRHVGTLGQWHPPYVLYTVPRAGQTGYHKRTELNKQIMKIGDDVDAINPKGGFVGYGFVKNDYIILKGSIPGPAKRLVRLRRAVFAKPAKEPKITYISTESKQ
jgi:large subunit ribosomal protein L3